MSDDDNDLEDPQPVRPFEPLFAPFAPFPVEVLPEPVRAYVVAQADAVDTCDAAVALPVLSTLASAIGGSRSIRLKKGWQEPAVIWTALVSRGEADPAPAIDAAVAPLLELQQKAERLLVRRQAELAAEQQAELQQSYRHGARGKSAAKKEVGPHAASVGHDPERGTRNSERGTENRQFTTNYTNLHE